MKFHLDHAAVSRLLETNTSTARAIHELETELGSAVAFLSSYGPGIRKETLRRYARMVNAMVNGVMNTIVYGTLSEAQRSALIDELKSSCTPTWRSGCGNNGPVFSHEIGTTLETT